MATIKTPNPSAVLSEGKKIRSVSKKRYTKVQNTYNSALEAYNQCKDTIASLKQITTSRQTVVKADKAKGLINDLITELRPAQLVGKQKELVDAVADLRRLTVKLSKAGTVYKSVSRNSKTATKHKIAGFDERRQLASEALGSLDFLKGQVSGLFVHLGKAKHKDLAPLKELATARGLKFHQAFIKVLRKELKDPKVRAMVLASPKAQGELSRMVRRSFGYVKKS